MNNKMFSITTTIIVFAVAASIFISTNSQSVLFANQKAPQKDDNLVVFVEDELVEDQSKTSVKNSPGLFESTQIVSQEEAQATPNIVITPDYNQPSFYTDNEAGIEVPTDNMGDDGTNYS